MRGFVKSGELSPAFDAQKSFSVSKSPCLTDAGFLTFTVWQAANYDGAEPLVWLAVFFRVCARMQLREVIFQGIWGYDKATRLSPEAEFTQLVLPRGVDAEKVQDLLISLFYPRNLSAQQQKSVQSADTATVVVVFSNAQGQRFRLIREGDRWALRLQREQSGGVFQDAARGVEEVERALRELLKLPEIGVFLALNLWRFEAPPPAAATPVVAKSQDPRVPELIGMYHQSLEVETIEDSIQSLEQHLEQAQRALGDYAEVADKLERAREKLAGMTLPDITSEELEVLEGQERQLDEYDQQIGRLLSEEDAERRQLSLNVPDKPYRTPLFLLGVAIGVTSIMVSVVFPHTLCVASMVNVLGAGMICWTLLAYFNDLGRASVHQVRLESIRRRLNQVREEQINFLEEIDHIMIHSGVSNLEELSAQIPRAAKLQSVIERLEAQFKQLQSNPQHRKGREEADKMQRELKALRARRADLPEYVMNSYQLENDLQSLGIEPTEIREMLVNHSANHSASGEGDVESGVEDPADALVQKDADWTAFQRLRHVAELAGLWSGGQLDGATQKMWAKICGHVVSERFSEVVLTNDGKLQIGGLTAEQMQMWSRTRSAEERAVILALALSMHINSDEARTGLLRSLWLSDLNQQLTAGHSEKFESVFRSASKKSQIVICKAER